MRSDEYEAFAEVVGDLCAAFDRPSTDARNRTFWGVLKGFHLHDVRRAAEKWKATQRKMPAPIDLKPERSTAPVKPIEDEGPAMSSWAIAANKILRTLAYSDERRGFRPIAVWQSMPQLGWGLPLPRVELVDGSALDRILAIKADYVRMAEDAEKAGELWDEVEFNRMCREGFEQALGMKISATAVQTHSHERRVPYPEGDQPSAESGGC